MKKAVFQHLLGEQTNVTETISYVIASLCTIILFVFYYGFGIKNILPTMLGIYVVCIIINILFYKVHKNNYLSYLVLISMSYLLIMGVTCVSGGIWSPFAFILVTLPIGAFITSQNHGKFGFFISIFSILILYKADYFGIPIMNLIPVESRRFFSFLILLFLLIIITLFSLLVKQSTYQLHKAYDTASTELERKSKRLENLKILLNYTKDLMCVIDLDTLVIEDLNPKFKIILGYELSELRGQKISNYITVDDPAFSLSLDFGSLKDDEVIEFNCKIKCKNGIEKPFSWIGIAKNGKLHASATEI